MRKTLPIIAGSLFVGVVLTGLVLWAPKSNPAQPKEFRSEPLTAATAVGSATTNPRMVGGPTRVGSPLAVGEARSRSGLDVPACEELDEYYLASPSLVYGHARGDEDLLLIVHSISESRAGPISVSVPGMRRATTEVHGVEAWGYDSTPGILPRADGRGSSGTVVRSYITWNERNAAIQLSSKLKYSLSALADMAESCTLP